VTGGARDTGSAGYSGTPLPRKLGITDEAVFAVLHEPEGFATTLGDVGGAVWQRSLMPPLDVVLAFHTRREPLVHEWPRLTAAVQPAGAVWVAWPKRTSGVATELTEDVLRELILPTGWVDNKVCAVDATWSALRFVLRREHRPGGRRRR
jgi:hypothetical protein